MKRIVAVLLALVMLLSLTACHKHGWVPATCDKPKTCSGCGKTEGDPLGHKWAEPSYEWSEDLSSVTASRVCQNDPSHVESETADSVAKEIKAATCTEAGETSFTAEFENAIFAPQTRTEALPEALGHAWGEPSYEWSEDLSSVVATRVCENDPSHVETEIADVAVEVTKQPGCEEPGETVYTAAFGNPAFEVRSRAEALPEALGHDWGERSFEWADDLSTVTATRVCRNDPSHIDSETVPVTAEVKSEASCEEPGETIYTAVFENEAFEAQSRAEADIEALGHVWGEPSYAWSEDLSSVTATRVCEHDPAHVETETVQTAVSESAAPSCEGAGETAYVASFENEAFSEQIRVEANIEALGHAWGEPSYAWSKDLSSVTATRVCANDPSHVETETAAVRAEVAKPATCTEMGDTAYTAAFENAAFETQIRTETDVPALGHAWSESTYEWAEDLSSVTATRVCQNDPSHVETEIAAVGAEVTKPATCTEMGGTTYTAVFGSEVFETQVRTETDIDALGHSWNPATHAKPQTCTVCGETEGKPLPIRYFDMSFKDYRYAFNHTYPGFLYIDATYGRGFTLHIQSDKIVTNGLDETIRFYHADEFDRGSRSSLKELKRFNLIEITYVSDSPKFDTSLSARVAQLGYYAAKILDPGLGQTAFFKKGLDLFDAKGNEQSFTHNGFVYTLACERVGTHYRYVFRMTLEGNIDPA